GGGGPGRADQKEDQSRGDDSRKELGHEFRSVRIPLRPRTIGRQRPPRQEESPTCAGSFACSDDPPRLPAPEFLGSSACRSKIPPSERRSSASLVRSRGGCTPTLVPCRDSRAGCR